MSNASLIPAGVQGEHNRRKPMTIPFFLSAGTLSATDPPSPALKIPSTLPSSVKTIHDCSLQHSCLLPILPPSSLCVTRTYALTCPLLGPSSWVCLKQLARAQQCLWLPPPRIQRGHLYTEVPQSISGTADSSSRCCSCPPGPGLMFYL